MSDFTVETSEAGEIAVVEVSTGIVSDNNRTSLFGFGIDGGGSAIANGTEEFFVIPFACTILAWEVVADRVGSIVVDIWKSTYANYPPTIADTITGSEKPTLASAQKSRDTSLSTWSPEVEAGDHFICKVQSVSTVQKAKVFLTVIKV